MICISLSEAVIVDIDGTVSLRTSRSPYDMSRVLEDQPNEAVVFIVNLLAAQGIKVIFVSGRDESARKDTLDFLALHIPCVLEPVLFMRAIGDQTEDHILKKQIYLSRIQPSYKVIFVLDDRDRVVNMWRHDLGLSVFQVAEGNF